MESMNKTKRFLPSLGFFVFLLLAWQVFRKLYDSILIPSTFGMVRAFFKLVTEGSTWNAFWISNQTLVLGFVISSVVGIAVGLLLGRVAWLERAVFMSCFFWESRPEGGIESFFQTHECSCCHSTRPFQCAF